MTTTPTQTDSLTTHWMSHVKQWRDSGQSQARYCKAHELSYHRFIYWRKKFEDEESGGDHLATGSFSAGFASVAYRASEPGLSVSLPNGVTVRGISADNVMLLGTLLDRLS